MSEETPSFSAKPVGETPKKPRRRAAPRRTPSKTIPRPANAKEITDSLSAIYRDDKGNIPDMRQIEIRKTHPFVKFLSTLLFTGILVAAGLWTHWWFKEKNTNAAATDIVLSVSGPETTTLGDTTTYTVSYLNTANIDVKNVILDIIYPDGFVFVSSSAPSTNAGHNEWKLSDIPGRGRGSLLITGQNFSALHTPASWRAVLHYRPINLNSDLQKVATFSSTVADSPFTVSITGADTVSVGAETAYSFTVKNTDPKLSLPAVYLSPVWPSNFTLTSSTPPLDKNNRWIVSFPTSSSTSSSPALPKFVARGTFGKSDTTSTVAVGAMLGATLTNGTVLNIASSTLLTSLITTDLNFNVAINGSLSDFSAQPGDQLNVTLDVKNSSAKEVKNAKVSITFDAPAAKKQSILNWSGIVDKFDGDIQGQQIGDAIRRGTITWDSKKIPALAKLKPGSDTAIELVLPIKTAKTFDLNALTTSTMVVKASLSFTDETGALQTIDLPARTVTINSDLTFESTNKITTTPDGKKQFDIMWVLNNTFHQLKDITISATVFGDTSVQIPSTQPAAGTFSYDTASKKITWHIDTLPESVDVANAPFTVVLNKENPTQNMLVSKVTVTATDTVTGQTIQITENEIPLNVEN